MNDITLTSKPKDKELEQEEKKIHYTESTDNVRCNCSRESKTADTPVLNKQRGRYIVTK